MEHILHYLFILIPFVLALCILYRDKAFAFSHFQRLVIFVLVVFVGVHAHFGLQTFVFDHQSQSGSAHPCCSPQAADANEIVRITPVESSFQELVETLPRTHYIQSTVVHNTRAPPVVM